VLVGGVITTFAGWQMIFWVNVPIGAGAIVAALVLLGSNGPTRAVLAQLDLPGAVAAVTGLGALVFGIRSADSDGWTAPKTPGVLVVSGLLLVAFGFIERRAQHPSWVTSHPGSSQPVGCCWPPVVRSGCRPRRPMPCSPPTCSPGMLLSVFGIGLFLWPYRSPR
jgi:hypothetical protein